MASGISEEFRSTQAHINNFYMLSDSPRQDPCDNGVVTRPRHGSYRLAEVACFK
jgi:hypothetical protein